MSYLPPVVSRRAHVFISLQLFLGGLMFYFPLVVSRRTHALFTSSGS
jgi:hypothetical protein